MRDSAEFGLGLGGLLFLGGLSGLLGQRESQFLAQGAVQLLARVRVSAQEEACVLPPLPDALADARIWILRYEEGGKYLYRARFVGFDERGARRTCGQLKRKGISCLPISPEHDPARVPVSP